MIIFLTLSHSATQTNTHVIHVYDMTHVWHDSFICLTWLIQICGGCWWVVTWCIHMRDITHCMRDMTYSCAWHDQVICDFCDSFSSYVSPQKKVRGSERERRACARARTSDSKREREEEGGLGIEKSKNPSLWNRILLQKNVQKEDRARFAFINTSSGKTRSLIRKRRY